MESHAKDHQQFTIAIGNRQKRAKALLDFERSDNDELGFKKNDIITVVSQKDEHCWVRLIHDYFNLAKSCKCGIDPKSFFGWVPVIFDRLPSSLVISNNLYLYHYI